MFELNDLSHVKPPQDAMSRDERFIGPIFDEFGVRFLLVYNQKLKAFHYLLDETITPNETFTPSPSTDRILIGKRTGFAFYRDHKLNRKILIGVYRGQCRASTTTMTARSTSFPTISSRAIRCATPFSTSRLTSRAASTASAGSFDGETRYMIAPYTQYATEDDLLMFHRCAESKDVPADQYHLCFVYDESEDDAAQNAPAPGAAGHAGPGVEEG